MGNKILKNFIAYLLIASIFITGEGWEGSIGFKFYWYYPVYALFIIYSVLTYRKADVRILLFLLILIAYSFLTFESDVRLVVKQLINVCFSSLVFYYFIRLENYDIEGLFKKYIRVSKIVLLIGFMQLVFYSIGWRVAYLTIFPWLEGVPLTLRLLSVAQEPSYIALTFAPVVFVALHNLFYRSDYFISRKWSLLFVIGYLLTQSAIAFTGIC